MALMELAPDYKEKLEENRRIAEEQANAPRYRKDEVLSVLRKLCNKAFVEAQHDIFNESKRAYAAGIEAAMEELDKSL